MPIKEAIQALIPRLIKLIPPKLHFEHEKSSDVELLALELLRLWNKQPYRKNWFVFMKLNFFPNLPSYTQIYHRIERLGEAIDAFQQTPQQVGMLLIDSFPLPVCRPKRSASAKVRFASMGFGTQGKVFGFKCHAWLSTEGQLIQHIILPANEHDFSAACQLNAKWIDFGCPKMIGDKAYVSASFITPPKINATRVDHRWKKEYGALRIKIERTFSWLVGVGLRTPQIKTLKSLKARVAIAFLAHNLWFGNP